MMTQINLLPWRERKRVQDKKIFISMFLGCGVFAIFIVFLINYYASLLVGNQAVRNKMLQNEINRIDTQLKEIDHLKKIREMLRSKMSIVHHLQSARILMVHLFSELIQVIPSGIYLTQLEGKQNKISVIGYAKSNVYISMLMKNIENNEWLHDPILHEIKREGKQQSAGFKLTFLLAPQVEMGVRQ
jgi:type IV pilus assembly protein PilN